MLTGPSGAGKTTMARALAAGWGATVLEVVGMAELGDTPLAAFARQVDDLGLTGAEPLARALTAAIGRSRPLPLLFVDDAPLLDATSAAVVYQLVRVYGAPAVLTARSEHPLRGPIERLVHENLAATLEVPGLERDQVGELLRRRYDAMPRPDDVARLVRQSAGNPLVLRDLVRRTEQWGGVRSVAAGVELAPVDVPAGAAAAVAERVGTLAPAQRDVMIRLALAPGAAVAVVLTAEEQAVAAGLVDQGLAVRDSRELVRPVHPLLGECALAGLDEAAREQVTEEVAARLAASGAPHLRFRAVLLRCATQAGATPTELAWAIEHAYGQGEHLLVDELHGLLAGPDGTGCPARSLVQWASSLSWLHRLDEADTAFEAADVACVASSDRALLLSCWGTHLAYRRFDPARAVALAERELPVLAPRDRQLLAPEVSTWRTLAGEVGDAQAVAGVVGADAGANGAAVAVRAAVAAVMLDAMGGRAGDDAARVLVELERTHGVLEPHAAAMVALQRYFGLLARGRGAEAERMVEEQRVAATADAAGIWTYTLAIHLMYGGRLARAAELAVLAQAQLRWRDPIGLLGASRVLEAVVVVHQGDPAAARKMLDGIAREQRADPKAAMLLAEAEALLLAAEGERDRAAEVVVASAARARDQGFALVAAISLSICLRIGRPERAAPLLDEIAASVDADLVLYQALARAAGGLVRRDAAAVLAAAEGLGRGGMAMTAADLLRQAEPMAPLRGAAELRHRIHRARRAWSESNEAVDLGDAAAGDVSAREWQVAGLACARRTSREIAEELGISIRTVDNHLRNLYRKLGVSGRSEMRQVLGAD